jgi:two-component system NtrC family response regulator
MSKQKILVIDDDEPIRTQMKWALIQDYDLFLTKDGAEAIQIMKKELPSLVTLDLGLPPTPEDTVEGLRVLEEILAIEPSTKVVVVTGNPDKSAALKAISLGAHDFFTKPIDLTELKAILKRASYVHSLEMECQNLQKQVHQQFSDMVGSSSCMQDIFSTIKKVSTTDVPVLISGESGTGKELVARAIHSNSSRSTKPFIPINCGAIPENLLESELFGHEKGAFTGAHVQRKGKTELADGGTLFLDEIGEMPLQLQVKLLRFLQDFKIERVGGREELELDVRIIAATNKDLKKHIENGKFREDLYYRLAVVTLEMPALRERGSDALLLARFFLQKFSSGVPKKLSSQAINAINTYNWPGNVRELENRIRRAMTLAEEQTITPFDLGLGSETEESAKSEQGLNLKKAVEDLEVRLIHAAILRNDRNISKAAEDLGLSRPTLYSLLKKYGITV